MSRQKPYLLGFVIVVLSAGLLGALFWGNYQYVVSNPGGTDFLVHWVGTRSYAMDGLSPYSDEVALRIQQMVYGRAALPGEHELRVAYPLYSILLFFPFALIQDFNVARAVWMVVLEVGLILLTFMSLNLTRWRPKPFLLLLLLLFSLFWYHSLRPVILGNAVILVALGFVAVLVALRNGQDELAGVLLGFTTIKPQLTVIFILFVVIWCIYNRRWKLVLWLGITMALLVSFASLLIPDWILQNLREVIRYPAYNPPGTVSAALGELLPQAGRRLGNVISILTGVVLLIEWFFSLRAGFRGFLWASCLTLIGSFWIGIQTDPGNFIVAYPALILIFSLWCERWRRGGELLTVFTMLILFAGIWGIFIYSIEPSYQPIQSPVMFLPLPILIIPLLYWVRWWAIQSHTVWFDRFTHHILG